MSGGLPRGSVISNCQIRNIALPIILSVPNRSFLLLSEIIRIVFELSSESAVELPWSTSPPHCGGRLKRQAPALQVMGLTKSLA